MDASAALRDIRGYAAAGRIVLSAHARLRMSQRGASASDVRSSLASAVSCVADGLKWKVTGPDLDGDELTCIVSIEDGVIVVTLY